MVDEIETKIKDINFNISTTTIVKIVITLIVLWFLYLIRDILAILFVSLIFASAIDPWVDRLQRYRIPRGVSISLIYLLILGILSLIVGMLIPPIIEQIGQLSGNFPIYYEKIINGLNSLQQYSESHGLSEQIQENLGALQNSLSKTATSVFSFLSSVFGGIISLFLVLVITFYMTVEETAVKKLLRSIAPANYQPYATQIINRMQRQIGKWLRGQLILCLLIGILSYAGLLLFRVEYALVLALLAGVFEFIPYLGPILAAVPAVFLVALDSPGKAVLVLLFYMGIQWLENNLLVPKIMQRVVGLNPIVSIVVLLIGMKLGGVVGALLAIPAATALAVLINDLLKTENVEEEGAA